MVSAAVALEFALVALLGLQLWCRQLLHAAVCSLAPRNAAAPLPLFLLLCVQPWIKPLRSPLGFRRLSQAHLSSAAA